MAGMADRIMEGSIVRRRSITDGMVATTIIITTADTGGQAVGISGRGLSVAWSAGRFVARLPGRIIRKLSWCNLRRWS